jgi:surfactin synthase thioesterase subunit
MPPINVFCLPFAGGSKAAYTPLLQVSPPSLHLHPVELPGRGTRSGELLLTDLDAIVNDILSQISNHLQHPYAIYGHSMGSLLAYLLAIKIVQKGLNQPQQLFLTGKAAPSVPPGSSPLYLLPNQDLKQALKEMGGIPHHILTDNRLLSYFLPVIRTDLMITETYRYEGPANLTMPITVITGTEEKLHPEKTEPWRLESSGEVEISELSGGHFFIFDRSISLLGIIARKLLPASSFYN